MKFVKIPYPQGEFEMQDALVTQSQWEKVMGNNMSQFKGKNNPVEHVSWDDCQEFIKKVNESQHKYVYRLPSEPEWEFAAGQAPSEKKITAYAWCYENSKNKTHPVKKKKRGAFGLYDMRGNVWEWTYSLYAPEGSYRVFRGGGWNNFARVCRSADRGGWRPDGRGSFVGFRLVRTKLSSSNTWSLGHSETRAAKVEAILLKIDELKKLVEDFNK